jgi:hypothetical protein
MYFVQVVNDGTPGALYEAGDDYQHAQELLLKVIAQDLKTHGPVEITDEVREFVESDGYYETSFGVGFYIVASERFSDEPDEDGFNEYVGSLYHDDHGEESLGDFQDGRFVPSRYLLGLSPEWHRAADDWATNFIGEQQEDE